MNKTQEMTARKPNLQESIVILTFASDVSRLDALRIISRIDMAPFPRIKEIISVAFFESYFREPKAKIVYSVECPWTEDTRPILEACFAKEAARLDLAGAIESYRVLGVG